MFAIIGPMQKSSDSGLKFEFHKNNFISNYMYVIRAGGMVESRRICGTIKGISRMLNN